LDEDGDDKRGIELLMTVAQVDAIIEAGGKLPPEVVTAMRKERDFLVASERVRYGDASPPEDVLRGLSLTLEELLKRSDIFYQNSDGTIEAEIPF
jgi:hypothetical protein